MAKKKVNYQDAVEEIESIIAQIESGEPDVDELSALVKRAAILIKDCKKKLKTTEESLAETLEELD